MSDSGKPWRIQSDDEGGVDEVVVGGWLHVERMDERLWCVRIGDALASVTMFDDGRVALDWTENPPDSYAKAKRRGSR